MKKVRVAVLGYGHLGKWHCQKVATHSDSAEFVAIVEKFPEAQKAAQANHPHVKVVSDINEVIHDIDAAFVVTPTSTHFEIVKFLLENNKHVFCEKPLCSNDKEAQALKLLADAKNVVIQVGQSERFHEAWEILSEEIHALPTPFSVRLTRVAPFKGRATDVDVIQDLGIHDLDIILHVLKQKPLNISTTGYVIRTQNLDHAIMRVELEDGCTAIVTDGRNGTKEIRELEIVSKAGTITVDLFTNKILKATSGQYENGSFVKEIDYNKRDHLLLEHKYFYQSILENRPAIVDLRAGLNAVHVVDCALRSYREGRAIEVSLA